MSPQETIARLKSKAQARAKDMAVEQASLLLGEIQELNSQIENLKNAISHVRENLSDAFKAATNAKVQVCEAQTELQSFSQFLKSEEMEEGWLAIEELAWNAVQIADHAHVVKRISLQKKEAMKQFESSIQAAITWRNEELERLVKQGQFLSLDDLKNKIIEQEAAEGWAARGDWAYWKLFSKEIQEEIQDIRHFYQKNLEKAQKSFDLAVAEIMANIQTSIRSSLGLDKPMDKKKRNGLFAQARAEEEKAKELFLAKVKDGNGPDELISMWLTVLEVQEQLESLS